MAAQTLCRNHSALGAVYHRLQAHPKPLTLPAHKLVRIFYTLWTRGAAYFPPNIHAYEQHRQRTLKQLQKTAQVLGFDSSDDIY